MKRGNGSPTVSFDLLPTTPSDLPAVTEFLARIFGTPRDAPFLEPALLRWKYYDPHPDWGGSRSFVLRQDDKIAAHACVFPVALVTARGEVPGIHIIDWAAGKDLPGAGVLLMRKLGERAGFLLTVGGSAPTRAILPRIGFQQRGSMELFARTVRPWQQFRSYPAKNWKSPLRLARNVIWSLAPLVRPAGIWSAEPVRKFDNALLAGLRTLADRPFTPARRTADLLNHMLRCPGAVFSGYLLREGGSLRGYFVLSRVGAQYRIADLNLDSEEPAAWQAGVAVAAACASSDPACCEVAAGASIPLLGNALRKNGFRPRDVQPIFLSESGGALENAAPFHLTLLDSDACFLVEPDMPFLA